MFQNVPGFMHILNGDNVHKNRKILYMKYPQIWWENIMRNENRTLSVEKMFSLYGRSFCLFVFVN